MNVASARILAIAMVLPASGLVWCANFHGAELPSPSDAAGADAPAPPGTGGGDSAPTEAGALAPTCRQSGCAVGTGCCLGLDGSSLCITRAECASNHAFLECMGRGDCQATTTGRCCVGQDNAAGFDLQGHPVTAVLHTYCGNPDCVDGDLVACKDTTECVVGELCDRAVPFQSPTFPSDGITDCHP